MTIQPFFLGSGRASQAVREALSLLSSEFSLLPPVQVARGEKPTPSTTADFSIIFVATPHALHANQVQEAAQAGFHGIGSEKPSCVNEKQLEELRSVKLPVALFHVYRQMWGPQTLLGLIKSGQLGSIITLEGRYWQASTAERAIDETLRVPSWKNNIELSGPSDALLDVGVHWLDLVTFLAEAPPTRISGWKSFLNSEANHRDSHVHLNVDYPSGVRALGSISKTVHGASNHFGVTVIGTLGSASWDFMNPDQITLGRGRETSTLTRRSTETGLGHPPHHSGGWLEGYVEINRQFLRQITGQPYQHYPTLQESLPLMEKLLHAKFETQHPSLKT